VFTSDWKIDVTATSTTTKDTLGWEYWYQHGVGGRRRRRWLRTMVKIEKPVIATNNSTKTTMTKTRTAGNVTATTTTSGTKVIKSPALSSPTTTITTAKKRTKIQAATAKTRRKKYSTSLPQKLFDSYNFKGFGWSFYKSIIFPSSFGIALRIPLSINWDWYERHPYLPSFTSAIGLYYPYTIALLVSASLPMEVVKFVFNLCVVHTIFVLRWVWCIYSMSVEVFLRFVFVMPLWIVRSFVWKVCNVLVPSLPSFSSSFSKLFLQNYYVAKIQKILLYQNHKKDNKKKSLSSSSKSIRLLGQTLPPLKPTIPSMTYSSDIVERVGMSMSWRYKKTKGYEFRISYWHVYLPTIIFLQSVLVNQWENTLEKKRSSLEEKKKRRAMKREKMSVSKIGKAMKKFKNEEEEEDSLVSSTKEKEDKNKEKQMTSSSPEWLEYIKRRTGSFGLTSSTPIPDPPYYSCSFVLSLSGYYYGQACKRFFAQVNNVMRSSSEDVLPLSPSSSLSRTATTNDLLQRTAQDADRSSIEKKKSDDDDADEEDITNEDGTTKRRIKKKMNKEENKADDEGSGAVQIGAK